LFTSCAASFVFFRKDGNLIKIDSAVSVRFHFTEVTGIEEELFVL